MHRSTWYGCSDSYCAYSLFFKNASGVSSVSLYLLMPTVQGLWQTDRCCSLLQKWTGFDSIWFCMVAQAGVSAFGRKTYFMPCFYQLHSILGPQLSYKMFFSHTGSSLSWPWLQARGEFSEVHISFWGAEQGSQESTGAPWGQEKLAKS